MIKHAAAALSMTAILLVTTVGCQSDDSAAPDAIAQPQVQPAMTEVKLPPTYSDLLLGKSVKGEPITVRIFGTGSPTVFIMGGIHGDERTSVDLTTNLIALLEKNPAYLAGKRVAILRVANPDGYAANKRVNAHGVDVNRNFPASNYKSSKRFGSSSASEPETRAVISALDQLKPALIISIHSISKGRECNNYDGPAEDIARAMSAHNKYPVTPTIGYATPGSMGTYAGIDKKIPMITLELPRTASGEESWTRNKDALLAAIREAR
jgi:murein peptide amidase A